MPESVLHALLVEDDPELAQAIEEWLRSDGWQVCTVFDGYEALCALDREPVHLIVLDHWLPHFNGSQVLAYLQAIAIEVPVLMMTGRPAGLIHGSAPSPSALLRKPFGARDLIDTVRRLVPRGPVPSSVSGTYSSQVLAGETRSAAGGHRHSRDR